METYYKYSGLMNVNFFKNPTVKLSVPAHLNDPYECQPSTNIKQGIEIVLQRPCSDAYITTIEQMIQSNGIISLSETQRNSLMWAHYGDHHKGMCIGLSPDFMVNKMKVISSDEEYFSDYCMSVLSPKKVNYDNHRFDINRKLNAKNVISDAFTRHFLTKSDEWIYEKEHRCIVSYLYATHLHIKNFDETVLFDTGDEFIKISVKKAITSSIKHGLIEKTKDKNLFKICDSEISLVMLSSFSEFSGVSFLQEINPESIKEIYFGCRSDKKQVREIFDNLQAEGHPLKHVNLYYFSISKERFELTPNVLDENYFK
ncbi:DUF2971 domain-containing protein [Aeromonas dhakensis]|uniref:DUF2971 domain-containing protein n=1 Tax=Aeromonas dhakensis TaxID=196024 RepID=UPI0039B7883E